MMIKRFYFCVFLCFLCVFSLQAQQYKYVQASSLTLVGKLFPDTPTPYHRLDTCRFKGFTKAENLQVRESAGIAVAFSTNSAVIRVRTLFGQMQTPVNTTGISAYGYDLYIKKDGQWLWAGAAGQNKKESEVTVVADLDGSPHECLLYLPLFSEPLSVEVGVEENATVEALPLPFRHRIGIFGSSFTHGTSTSRGGMTYPAQLSRATGLQLLSLGCSGNCKMQPYFAAALEAADVDAFLFDTFSNPSEATIKERLFPFIERMTKAHPGKPLIFQRTIYRENRNFNTASAHKESSRIALADSLMNEAMHRYPDVYYICPSATSPSHETSVDGIHPGDYGYTLWAQSIQGAVSAILRKYGIQ